MADRTNNPRRGRSIVTASGSGNDARTMAAVIVSGSDATQTVQTLFPLQAVPSAAVSAYPEMVDVAPAQDAAASRMRRRTRSSRTVKRPEWTCHSTRRHLRSRRVIGSTFWCAQARSQMR
jgi:hypothetical protein